MSVRNPVCLSCGYGREAIEWTPHVKVKETITLLFFFLQFAIGFRPKIIYMGIDYIMYYSPTKLERLYHQLGAKNRCTIKEANRISLI